MARANKLAGVVGTFRFFLLLEAHRGGDVGLGVLLWASVLGVFLLSLSRLLRLLGFVFLARRTAILLLHDYLVVADWLSANFFQFERLLLLLNYYVVGVYCPIR
jgi:hypothetical protein